jgi:hypothetical protein
MQFKVPQNITMEDRIAGPLTLVQFSILVVGGGIAFFFLNMRLIAPANQIIALVLALITVVLAIGRFNDQPMYRFIRFFVLFVITPRTRVWHKAGQEVALVKASPHKKKDEKVQATKQVSKNDIARLAIVLDSRGTAAVPPVVHPPR